MELAMTGWEKGQKGSRLKTSIKICGEYSLLILLVVFSFYLQQELIYIE